MKRQQFNPQEYAKLKHRVEALKSRVKLDCGPEQETARRLLAKVEKKLKDYEETHEIPKQMTEDYNTSSIFDVDDFFMDDINSHTSQDDEMYHDDTRSEEEIINDLGILYAIFGSTYQTVLNYHVYKIRFKRQADKKGAFYRVWSDIYEDEKRICKDVTIGFWPFHFGDDRCGDMEFSCYSSKAIEKYNNGCSILYITILDGLKDIWNFYFDNHSSVPMITGPTLGYIENRHQSSHDNIPEVQLDRNLRDIVIYKTENEIDSGKMKHLVSEASPYVIMAYRPFYSLIEFLDEAGIVYKVDISGVFIWNHEKKEFGKLVGYEYSSVTCRYWLYLL